MRIDIPLDYQPLVGETLSVQLTGKVIAVSINPFGSNMIIVTMETDEEKNEYVGPGSNRKCDPMMPTNGLPGSTY